MAKKNRSSGAAESTGFSVSKTKVGKPTLVTVTCQLTEMQECHLDLVAKDNETSRAELCKQAVAHCLNEMGVPFPDVADDELKEAMEARRAERKAWASRRGR